MIDETFDIKTLLEKTGGMISDQDAHLLFDSAMEINAQKMLEIGAMTGSSTAVLAYVAKKNNGHVWTIESQPHPKWEDSLMLVGVRQYASLIFGSSPWIGFGCFPIPFDFLLIDGNHLVRWVLADYHYWSPFVRSGGRIAFHDWTGANGVGEQIQEAVAIILRTDKLIEVGRIESTNRGLIVFEKTGG
jgi:hypothetical protein